MTIITQIAELKSGIFRLRAPNPGPMTGSGTNTYVLFGPAGAVVIDPGPKSAAHLNAIVTTLDNRPLRAILISHAHLDHTALTPALVAATDAPVLAFGKAAAGRSARMQMLADQGLTGGEGVDVAFAPDEFLTDEQTISTAGLKIDVIHTPGHMGGHLCFGLGEMLFSGDHVMGWSTSLVSPPDGDMAAYMASLTRLGTGDWALFLPGHGETIADPAARLAQLITHRRAREASILAALRTAPANPDRLAALLYTDAPRSLLPAAARNILAHLIDLHDRNLVITDDAITADATFRANWKM